MTRVAAVLLALSAAPALAQDDAKKVVEEIQGEWKMVEFVKEGKPEGKDSLGTVTIKGNEFVISKGDRVEAATFTLDPKAKPAAIDLKPGKAEAKDPVIKGIYKLEKDRLTICFGFDGAARPKEFKGEKENGLFVLERVKK